MAHAGELTVTVTGGLLQRSVTTGNPIGMDRELK